MSRCVCVELLSALAKPERETEKEGGTDRRREQKRNRERMRWRQIEGESIRETETGGRDR